eukprot:gene12808-8721_t
MELLSPIGETKKPLTTTTTKVQLGWWEILTLKKNYCMSDKKAERNKNCLRYHDNENQIIKNYMPIWHIIILNKYSDKFYNSNIKNRCYLFIIAMVICILITLSINYFTQLLNYNIPTIYCGYQSADWIVLHFSPRLEGGKRTTTDKKLIVVVSLDAPFFKSVNQAEMGYLMPGAGNPRYPTLITLFSTFLFLLSLILSFKNEQFSLAFLLVPSVVHFLFIRSFPIFLADFLIFKRR